MPVPSVFSLVLAMDSFAQQRLLLCLTGLLATSPPSSRVAKEKESPAHDTWHNSNGVSQTRPTLGWWLGNGEGEGRHGVA